MANAKWSGEASLRAKIANMQPAAKKALSEGVAENAAEMVALAKRLAPFDDGDLIASITSYWSGSAPPPAGASAGIARSQSRVAVKGENELAMTVTAGDDKAFYARWVEFGARAGKRGKPLPASPFFFVAFRAIRKRARARMGRKVRQAALAQRAS